MDRLLFYGYEFISTFVPFLIVFLSLKNFNKKRKTAFSLSYGIAVILFACYIAGTCHFAGAGTLYNGLAYRLEIRQDQLNLIPFSKDIDVAAYLLNILLCVPLGILVPLIWRKMDNWVYVLGTGAAFSSLIEVSQLLNNRRTDIDDLLLNTLGTAIGFALYRLWSRHTKLRPWLRDGSTAELPIYVLTLFVGRFLFFDELGLAGWLYGF